MTRIVTFLILLSFNLSSYPQPLSTEKKEILTSINSNLIDIENSNPDYAFKENTKLKNLFQDVKIYGVPPPIPPIPPIDSVPIPLPIGYKDSF